MDFAEFAQLLFPYYGADLSQADFVVMLIDAIVDEDDSKEIGMLNHKPDYLSRIFSGTKPLPKKSAREVNGRLNKVKFKEFLDDFDLTNDAIDDLAKNLAARGFKTKNRYEISGALQRLSAPRVMLSRYQLEREVEELLGEIELLDVSEETRLKMIPHRVENKISEKRLKGRVLQDVRELYDGVNDVLDRMAGENKLNVELFARSVRRMYEDANESDLSQSDVYYMLVESLHNKTKRKHRIACEVIVSYFVQRCEVFDEITK